MVDQIPTQPPNLNPKPSSGLEPNVAALLCYLCNPVLAIVFLIIEKENREVKFHAWQAIFLLVAVIPLYVVFMLLSMIPYLGYLFFALYLVLGLGMLVLSVICMIKAYQGEHWKIPMIGDYAEKQASK